MAPVLHLVRHAQGFHNLNFANHSMHDPQLTELGQQQCATLSQNFPDANKIDLVVASPLKRTIYTALLSFPGVIETKKLKVIALPEMQETSDLPCDTGSDLAELTREFKDKPVDFSLVTDGWNSKQGRWAPESEAIEERCKVARQWLRNRPEKNIVVVTHGGVLHYFTEDWSGSDRFAGTGWANTEFRSYNFDPKAGDSASLLETDESTKRRKGTEKPLSEAEQRNLKQAATRDMESSGYIKARENKLPQKAAPRKLVTQQRDWVGGFEF